MKECLIISKDDTHEQTNAWCVELPKTIFDEHVNEGYSTSGDASDVLTEVLEMMVDFNMITDTERSEFFETNDVMSSEELSKYTKNRSGDSAISLERTG